MEDYKIFNIYDSEKNGDPTPVLFLYEKYENFSHKKVLNLISKLGEFNQTKIYLQKIGFHGWKFWISKDHEFYSYLKKYQNPIHTQEEAAKIVFKEIPDFLDIKYKKSLPPEERLESLYQYFKNSLKDRSYYDYDYDGDYGNYKCYKVNRGWDKNKGIRYEEPNVTPSNSEEVWNIVKEMIERETWK